MNFLGMGGKILSKNCPEVEFDTSFGGYSVLS
jgi:hypothetical protein